MRARKTQISEISGSGTTKSARFEINDCERSMSCGIFMTIDLYTNVYLADRLRVFLSETERPDKSRKKDLVKKFGQKEVRL